MADALATRAGRNTDLVAVVSALLHVGAFGLAVFLVQESGSDGYVYLAVFAAVGLAATVLGWASVRSGLGTWTGGLVLVGLSVGVLVGALTQEGGLGVLSIAISMLFIDYLLFSNARRALT